MVWSKAVVVCRRLEERPVYRFVFKTHIVNSPESESNLPILVLTQNDLSQSRTDLCPPDANVWPRYRAHYPPDTWSVGQCHLLKRRKEAKGGKRWQKRWGGGGEEPGKKRCYIKIQLKIKWNVASKGGMWEDSFFTPPPVNEVSKAFQEQLLKSLHYSPQCMNLKIS